MGARTDLLDTAGFVCDFAHPHTGDMETLSKLLGGKGAGLWEMTTRLGLPVPPGFTLTTNLYERRGAVELRGLILTPMRTLETRMGRVYGGSERPLLVSVRSGAPVSMPGMMDTILNVGLTRATCEGLAAETSAAFAGDCYLRFLRMFGATVGTIPPEAFADLPLDGPISDRVETMLDMVGAYVPLGILQSPQLQLEHAIEAVFASWYSRRAISYRARTGISEQLGTAVNIQAMVFGNRGKRSGTGVVFTRDPTTGAPGPSGDYLPLAQGEDVVAGTHATQAIQNLAKYDPAAWAQLNITADRLERHYRDLCDIEFTLEEGVLWILQSRRGKRTAEAAIRIALDMADAPDFPLNREEALTRIDMATIEQVANRSGAGDVMPTAIARGLAASPGIASGRVCFSADAAVEMADAGEPAILMTEYTSPADVHGMQVAQGLVTFTGGMVSHAALIAREWGLPAIVGASALRSDGVRCWCGDLPIAAGDMVSIDGATGEIYLGIVASARAEETPILRRLRHLCENMVGSSGGTEALSELFNRARVAASTVRELTV